MTEETLGEHFRCVDCGVLIYSDMALGHVRGHWREETVRAAAMFANERGLNFQPMEIIALGPRPRTRARARRRAAR